MSLDKKDGKLYVNLSLTKEENDEQEKKARESGRPSVKPEKRLLVGVLKEKGKLIK